VVVRLGSASAPPGGTGAFEVTLRVPFCDDGITDGVTDGVTDGGDCTEVEVLAVEVQFLFDPRAPVAAAVTGQPDCSVNPEIGRNDSSFVFTPEGCAAGEDCLGVAALIADRENLEPIPDGATLFTCRVLVSLETEPGQEFTLDCTGATYSTASAADIEARCESGLVRVE
jgi:hypothetical protein